MKQQYSKYFNVDDLVVMGMSTYSFWHPLHWYMVMRGRGGMLTLINMNSNDVCHHRRHPSSSFVRWAGDVALPHCHYCWGGFGGGSDDEVEVVVVMVVWWPLLLM